jgi:hypothetical protein
MPSVRGTLVPVALILLARPVAAQDAPRLIQPGVISTEKNETFPAIDPIDGSLWLSSYTDNFDRQVIMRAARVGSEWQAPAVVGFSGKSWGDRAPRFSPDGKRLYVSSNRPLPGRSGAGTFHLWVLERRGSDWSEPQPLPEPVNSSAADRHSSETRSGDLYVSSTRPGGAGRSDIYRMRRVGAGWSEAERLPAPINDALSQPDLLVAPNGRWMILVITDHPEGLGGDDLFLSRLENGAWTRPERLAEPINSKEYEYGPSLSPDGRTLYFTSHRRGSADIYSIPTVALGITSR